MKNKKVLWITLIALDVLITGVLFAISIIMLANTPKSAEERDAMTGFIGYLVKNPTVYLVAFVIPLFVLLAANIIGLVIYVRKTTKREPVKVNDLTEAQKEKLRQELLNDLAKANQPAEAPKPSEPAPEPKPEPEPQPQSEEKKEE